MPNKHSLLFLLNPLTCSNNDVTPSVYKKFHMYDINKVDDKLRKRLLKNRQSAERSRQRKHVIVNGLLDEIESLKAQIKTMKKLLVQHDIPH